MLWHYDRKSYYILIGSSILVGLCSIYVLTGGSSMSQLDGFSHSVLKVC